MAGASSPDLSRDEKANIRATKGGRGRRVVLHSLRLEDISPVAMMTIPRHYGSRAAAVRAMGHSRVAGRAGAEAARLEAPTMPHVSGAARPTCA
jgi:hypothetical protein